jgi:transposase
MAQFASAHHLASSWIGVCPGQNESAGVSRSGHTRPGNSNLKRLLGIAAMVAIKNKDSYLGVFFRRLAARRGGKRALVVVMHKLAIAIWHILRDKVAYRELGADHFTRRDPERAMRRMVKEANALGLTVRFEPLTT